MIPADLSAELTRAIKALVAAGDLPPAATACHPAGTWRPAPPRTPAPARARRAPAYATSLPFDLARVTAQPPAAIAARLAAALQAVDWISSATPAGPGYLTITVTPAALTAVAARTSQAGPSCAGTNAPSGRPAPAATPPLPDLTSPLTWPQAWQAQAAALSARLAQAAAATPHPQNPTHHPKRNAPRNPTHPLTPPTPADAGLGSDAAAARGAAVPQPGVAGEAGPAGGLADAGPGTDAAAARGAGVRQAGVAGDAGVAGGLADGGPERAVAPDLTVAGAVKQLGADVVRFWLARMPAARAGVLDGHGPVTRDVRLVFPGFAEQPAMAAGLAAVRFAHDDAAATLRWAGELGLGRGAPPGAGELGEAAEIVLLERLSWLGERVASAARRGEPSELPRYLERLAMAWADCRERCPALRFGGRAAPGDAAGISARLWLADAVRAALAAGLELTGVDVP